MKNVLILAFLFASCTVPNRYSASSTVGVNNCSMKRMKPVKKYTPTSRYKNPTLKIKF